MSTFFSDHQTPLSLGGRWCARLWRMPMALNPRCTLFLVKDSLGFPLASTGDALAAGKKIQRFGDS